MTQVQPPDAPAGARFQELDALRGIASLWVMFYHFGLWYHDIYGPLHGSDLDTDARVPGIHMRYLGALPVFLFFMISGFVIVWSLEGARGWRDFVVLRLSRLFPVYWVALALTTAVGLLAPLPDQALSAGQILANVTMVQELIGVQHVDGVYWSLTIELLFYAGVAVVFACGLIRYLHALCAAWALGCVLNTVLALLGTDLPWRLQYYGLLTFGHFLIAGIMFYQIRAGRRPAASYAILALCVLSYALRYQPLVALVLCLFLAALQAAVAGRLRWLAHPVLLWLGGVSYALYLIHEMIGFRLIEALEASGAAAWEAAAAACACMLALAWLLHRTVELPAMRALRRRWRGWRDDGRRPGAPSPIAPRASPPRPSATG